MFLESAFLLAIKFVRVCYFCYTSNNYLSGQVESLFGFIVNVFVQGILLECLPISGLLANVITSSISNFQCMLECFKLFVIGLKFNWCY